MLTHYSQDIGPGVSLNSLSSSINKKRRHHYAVTPNTSHLSHVVLDEDLAPKCGHWKFRNCLQGCFHFIKSIKVETFRECGDCCQRKFKCSNQKTKQTGLLWTSRHPKHCWRINRERWANADRLTRLSGQTLTQANWKCAICNCLECLLSKI